MFTWKPIYREIAQALMAYRGRQADLLAILKEMHQAGLPVTGMKDRDTAGAEIVLAEIDPFTFFANFNRGTKEDSQRKIVGILKERFSLASPVPSDFHGIPSANLQNTWFFPYAGARDAGDVPALWDLAQACLVIPPDELDASLFDRCLKVKQVGAPKLTMGLFWLNPDAYLALDSVMADYLESKGLSISPHKVKSLGEYTKIIELVRQKLGTDYPQISRDAYLYANQVPATSDELDAGLALLLQKMADENKISVPQVVAYLIQASEDGNESEIMNRLKMMPRIRDLLESSPVKLDELQKVSAKLWVLANGQDAMRRNAFLNSVGAVDTIAALLDDAAGIEQTARIDAFIASAAEKGYTDPKGKDSSAAAQFASVLMSAKHPDRYVDFRGSRWNRLFTLIIGSNKRLCTGSSYARKITKAGKFAASLSGTPTFKKHFGSERGPWKVAGLAWNFKDGLFKVKGGVPQVKRYWAGGFLWGGQSGKGESHLDEFVSGNVWKTGYARDATDKKHTDHWVLFDQIKLGDEFAIKGYGGRNDLKVHYVGEVDATDRDNGIVTLKRLDRPLFHGKAPSAGSGNWFGTLLEVTDPDAVQKIFHGAPAPPSPDSFPLNLILYGPPGTGKTYTLQKKYMELFTEIQMVTREQFAQEVVAEMTWLQVITVVLYDLKSAKVSVIFDHPLLQAKNGLSANRSPKNTIWAWLQRHTKIDCPNVKHTQRDEPLIFWKDENATWTVDRDMVDEQLPELIEKLKIFQEFKPVTKKIKRYEYVTFHQSYCYEDFVEGIKPVLSEAVSETITYEIKPGIFKNMVKLALSDSKHDYALLIDEINRGNVASIFGELIALIEEDKRKGRMNELQAKLPYSREEFVVPDNLYIIGAMNTADRSVEALDTALRRRFTFVAVHPQPEQIQQPAGFEVDLRKLLVTINGRIEKLSDKDHCIGHSYFMGIEKKDNPLEELRLIFQTKILPLLEEYFYGDPGKIGMVLGERFITRKDEAIQWATGDWGADDYEERHVYTLANPMTLTMEDFRSVYEK